MCGRVGWDVRAVSGKLLQIAPTAINWTKAWAYTVIPSTIGSHGNERATIEIFIKGMVSSSVLIKNCIKNAKTFFEDTGNLM